MKTRTNFTIQLSCIFYYLIIIFFCLYEMCLKTVRLVQHYYTVNWIIPNVSLAFFFLNIQPILDFKRYIYASFSTLLFLLSISWDSKTHFSVKKKKKNTLTLTRKMLETVTFLRFHLEKFPNFFQHLSLLSRFFSAWSIGKFHYWASLSIA